MTTHQYKYTLRRSVSDRITAERECLVHLPFFYLK